LYRGNADTRCVVVIGGPQAQSGDGRGPNLARLGETDVWYRTDRVPNDARFSYVFLLNVPQGLPRDAEAQRKMFERAMNGDALNPHWIAEGGIRSIVEMPEAPTQPYYRAIPGTPAGDVP